MADLSGSLDLEQSPITDLGVAQREHGSTTSVEHENIAVIMLAAGGGRMSFETLTLKSVRARPVVLKLKRPVAARIAMLTEWPLILIDLHTAEGVIGRAYLEPYIPKSMRYLIPALHDLDEMLKGRR